MKNELVISKSIALVIKEAFICLAIRIVTLAQGFFAIMVNQMAGNLEIQRLNHETSLAVSEFVINNQSSFTFLFTFFALLLWIAAVYILIKDVIKIVKIFREGEK
jgi:hypothetical protein